MSEKQTDKHSARNETPSPGLEFFREESIESLRLGDAGQPEKEEQRFISEEKLPALPPRETADEEERKTYWRLLRNFFRTASGGGIADNDQQPAVYPALLAPYRQPSFQPGPFPVWAPDDKTKDRDFTSLSDLLREGIRAFAPQDGAARILKDNLLRLNRLVQEKVAFADIAYEAIPVLEEALRELETELNLTGDEKKNLEEDITRLKGVLPPGGLLIPAGPQAPLHLLGAYLRNHRRQEIHQLQTEVNQLTNRLKDILTVEKEKSPEAQSSEHLHDTLNFADNFVNFDELSSVLPTSGSDAMPEERRQRIDKILSTLEEAGGQLLHKTADLLAAPAIDASSLADILTNAPLPQASPEGLCRQAMQLFDERMSTYARIFAAVRLARLELNDSYRTELHADFFTHFDWRSFNDDEWAVCPPVCLLADDETLLANEINDLSNLLASNRPIRIFVLKRTIHPENGESADMLSGNLMNRQELAALAIAHRNVCVVQTAMVDPVFLLEGLTEGLAAFSPVLFYVFASRDGKTNTFLSTGAAVEGRAFPSLLYNSDRGPRWGSRFDIGNNPQFDEDWPVHELRVRNDSGEATAWRLPFTFAHFAAQDIAFARQFQIVPPAYWQEELIPLGEYLQLPAKNQFNKVPFIWLQDEQGTLQKAAVSWPLVLSCRNRLDYWHYLQENAGVHSYHVENATEQLQREITEKFTREKEALENKHREALEKTAEESARVAMERLAATLLEMEADAELVGAISPPPAPKEKPAPPPEEKQPPKAKKKEPEPAREEPAPVEQEDDLGEAWIDTPLCTSCNECIELNNKIFQYDANKQAYVADPKGGPFADIVKAAENCPVRIIHPGAPQNPKETGLKELVERAKPFH